MATIELSIVIAASRDKVWAYATDFNNWPKFVANVESVSLASGENDAGGVIDMQYKLVGNQSMKVSQTIVKIDASEGVWAAEVTEGFPGTNRWTYESIDDGAATRVSVKMDYKVPGSILGKIADSLIIERYNTKAIETSLENLKSQLT